MYSREFAASRAVSVAVAGVTRVTRRPRPGHVPVQGAPSPPRLIFVETLWQYPYERWTQAARPLSEVTIPVDAYVEEEEEEQREEQVDEEVHPINVHLSEQR